MTQQGHLKVVGDKGVLRLFNWRTSRGQIKGQAWGPRAQCKSMYLIFVAENNSVMWAPHCGGVILD